MSILTCDPIPKQESDTNVPHRWHGTAIGIPTAESASLSYVDATSTTGPQRPDQSRLPIMSRTSQTSSEQVVVQFGSRTLKGYLESPAWNTIEELLSNAPPGSPETFRIRHLDANIVEDIPSSSIKAVFYVNTFNGDPNHKDLNFHSRAQVAQGVWVRLQFLDGEVMEGIVYNSLRFLVDAGFFLLPTDPDTNNKMVYVVKSSLADHRVLGVRRV